MRGQAHCGVPYFPRGLNGYGILEGETHTTSTTPLLPLGLINESGRLAGWASFSSLLMHAVLLPILKKLVLIFSLRSVLSRISMEFNTSFFTHADAMVFLLAFPFYCMNGFGVASFVVGWLMDRMMMMGLRGRVRNNDRRE